MRTQKEAHRIVSGLLADMDDLVGIFVIGGGISGVLQALREAPEEKRRRSGSSAVTSALRRGRAWPRD